MKRLIPLAIFALFAVGLRACEFCASTNAIFAKNVARLQPRGSPPSSRQSPTSQPLTTMQQAGAQSQPDRISLPLGKPVNTLQSGRNLNSRRKPQPKQEAPPVQRQKSSIRQGKKRQQKSKEAKGPSSSWRAPMTRQQKKRQQESEEAKGLLSSMRAPKLPIDQTEPQEEQVASRRRSTDPSPQYPSQLRTKSTGVRTVQSISESRTQEVAQRRFNKSPSPDQDQARKLLAEALPASYSPASQPASFFISQEAPYNTVSARPQALRSMSIRPPTRMIPISEPSARQDSRPLGSLHEAPGHTLSEGKGGPGLGLMGWISIPRSEATESPSSRPTSPKKRSSRKETI